MRLLERLLASAFTIWLAATLAFFALRLLPGDAITAQLTQSGAGAAVIAERRAQQGLDLPVLAQYARYLWNAVRGDLGYSLVNGQPVSDLVMQHIGPTLALASGALAVGTALGVAFGAAGAFESPAGAAARALTSLALSTPIYWTGTLAIWVFAVWLGWLPSTGGEGTALALPAMVLGFHTAGGIARVVEASVRETRAADYVRTARAKGLPPSAILRRHVLRPALLPAMTVIGLQAGFLLGGTVISESLFTRPGLGRLLLDSVLQQDYAVVQGLTVLLATVYSLLNLTAELLYGALDPRIRLAA